MAYESERIEDICEEYKIKPYKLYGDKLPDYFMDLMSQTDKWLPLPFTPILSKPKKRFIDFIKGLDELNPLNPQNFDENIHRNENYSGFVKLKPEQYSNELNDLFTCINLITNGKVRYVQLMLELNSGIISKNACFVNNEFTMQIIGTSIEETEKENECIISNVKREADKKLSNGYNVEIVQLPSLIRIILNTKEHAMNRSVITNRVNPLVELDFEDEQYFSTLNELNTNKELFKDLYTMSAYFGREKIAPHSQILKILEKESRINLNRITASPNFNDAIYLINNYLND